ncbi:hypothetical protein LTR53_016695 [Teratosphaeriaceae sp. CCFEE 6253]|nr:hypothetical protein LTR53_016695 [Teratosphaeriaceae sp. CCFEE 6253]
MARMGDVFLRTTWAFQTVVASPVFFGMGYGAVAKIFANNRDRFYDLWADFFCAFLAAAIIFVVLVQVQLPFRKTAKRTTLGFEGAKAGLASGLWVWMLLDACFGPATRSGSLLIPEQRFQMVGICAFLLL